MAEISISAKARDERGKNAARRIRREGLIPAVVYGGKGETLTLAVDPKSLQKVLRSESGRNTILKLDIGGKRRRRRIPQAPAGQQGEQHHPSHHADGEGQPVRHVFGIGRNIDLGSNLRLVGVIQVIADTLARLLEIGDVAGDVLRRHMVGAAEVAVAEAVADSRVEHILRQQI